MAAQAARGGSGASHGALDWLNELGVGVWLLTDWAQDLVSSSCAGWAGKGKFLSTVDRRWKAGCSGAKCANCVAENVLEERRQTVGRVFREGA